MQAQRHEDEKYLEQRFARAAALINNEDIARDKDVRAFLLTPREKFSL